MTSPDPATTPAADSTADSAADSAAPTRALLVVDVQNDFCEGGALGVDGGTAVAAGISGHLDAHAAEYAAVVASRDWHEPHGTNGGHFAAPGTEPDFVDTWPAHCVTDGPGSDYSPALRLDHVTSHVRKGEGVPAYDAFEGVTDDGEPLADLLGRAGVTAVDVAGIATDHCVRATVLSARSHGLDVRVLGGLHAGVLPGTTEAAVAEMRAAGAVVEPGVGPAAGGAA